MDCAVSLALKSDHAESKNESLPTKATLSPSLVSAKCRTFVLQVGGHGQGQTAGLGMLVDAQGRNVFKPLQPGGRGQHEVEFYQRLFDPKVEDETLLQLRCLVPAYRGTTVDAQHNHYLVLENLAQAYAQPCVLDIKLGGVTTAPYATREKAERERLKYPQGSDIGFRLVGMKVYEPITGQYRHYERDYGYGLQEESIQSALREWLFNGTEHRYDVVDPAIAGVKRILRWFERNTSTHFFGCSLLLLYEGDTAVAAHRGKVTVGLIDFAHTADVTNLGLLDENNLFGLRKLLKIMEALREA